MLGRSHVIGAAAIGVAAAAATGHSPGEAVIVGAAATVTAKLPDVDRLVNKGPNHRSLTHSLVIAGGGVALLALIVSVGLGMIGSAVVFGLAVGYVSHLLLDSMTAASIPLIWPGGPKFSLGSIATGKLGERVAVWGLVAVADVVALGSFGAGV